MARRRVLMYVQHLMGIGHQRRAAAIARALEARGIEVTYVSGGMPVAGLESCASRFVQLPPARAADAGYRALVDERGEVVGERWKAARRALLLDAAARADPHLVVVESFPFGRGLVRFELVALMEALHARRPRPPIACSIRDVLEPRRSPEKVQRTIDEVRRWFDAVLVHGDPALAALSASFERAHELAVPVHHTGFITQGSGQAREATPAAAEVVVSGGGGVVAAPLLRAALAAAKSARGLRWRLLVGPDVGAADLAALRAGAGADVVVEPNRADFPSLLARAACSVSQAGYNTVTDILAAGVPAVLVPYAGAGEREQGIRAALLEREGIAVTLAEAGLSAATLAGAVEEARALPPPRRRYALDGAAATARIVESMIEAGAADASTGPRLARRSGAAAPWGALEDELAAWTRAGRVATLWWRDDDARAPSAALDRLLGLAERHRVRLGLAVIPRGARSALAGRVREDTADVLQHGYAHRNHARAGEKSCELGGERGLCEIHAELERGRRRLTAIFGDRFAPALVPPWNRIAPTVVATLAAAGFEGLSTFSSRAGAFAAPGLRQTNCHVDIVDWRGTRGFVGHARALADLTAHLGRRRTGAVDPDEPTGLLTHHRDHDAGCWAFVDELLARTSQSPAVRWISARAAILG